MRFNAKKCNIMSINCKSQFFYQLDRQILQQVEEVTYLGVTLSDNLKFGPHITKITKKANATLGFMRRNLKHCHASCRKTAFLALIRSTLEYSCPVWDPFLGKDIDRIERVQRQAARFITRDYTSRDPGCISRMLRDLGLPSLQDRRKDIRLAFFFKVVEGLVPAMPSDSYLTPFRSKRLRIGRQFTNCVATNIIERQEINNTHSFELIQARTAAYKNSFFPRTMIDWIKLPEVAVRVGSLKGFKSALLPRV